MILLILLLSMCNKSSVNNSEYVDKSALYGTWNSDTILTQSNNSPYKQTWKETRILRFTDNITEITLNTRYLTTKNDSITKSGIEDPYTWNFEKWSLTKDSIIFINGTSTNGAKSSTLRNKYLLVSQNELWYYDTKITFGSSTLDYVWFKLKRQN
jgi:hypothetical protein